jgi:peptidoglycan/LPS O-acetylase OafA/YrhL
MDKRTKHFAYVDMLRGIAVLMVVLVHTAQMIPNLSPIADVSATYGQMGVQLFFVASAYTICLSFDRRQDEPIRVTSFYLRRFFRIAPLYYCGIVVYFVAHLCKQLYSIDGVVSAAPYTFWNVLLNVSFLHGLVPAANNNIVPGGWSIGTEMLFYAIFPALFQICNWFRKKFGPIGMTYVLLVAITSNFVLQTCLYGSWLAIRNNSFMYFNIINQLPVFIVGIVAFFVTRDGLLPRSAFTPRILVIGFVAFSVGTIILWRLEINVLFAVIPTTAAISFFFLLNFLRCTGWHSRVLLRIGEVSYSIYVFHFIFAWHVIPGIAKSFQSVVHADLLLVVSFFSAAGLSIFLATIAEKLIEARGISVGSKLISYVQRRAGPYYGESLPRSRI